MSRIRDPFAPRAGVEARTAEACHLECEQVVASGDPGAAHGDQLLRQRSAQRVFPRAAQVPGLEEAALRIEVGGEGMIARPGDVPGDRIDRLVLARKAIGAARIDQQLLGANERARAYRGRDLAAAGQQARVGPGREAARCAPLRRLVERMDHGSGSSDRARTRGARA